jgi:hypothetical protein
MAIVVFRVQQLRNRSEPRFYVRGVLENASQDNEAVSDSKTILCSVCVLVKWFAGILASSPASTGWKVAGPLLGFALPNSRPSLRFHFSSSEEKVPSSPCSTEEAKVDDEGKSGGSLVSTAGGVAAGDDGPPKSGIASME